MPAVTVPSDPAVKDPTEAGWPAAVGQAIADLNANISVVSDIGTPNGSFEFDLEVTGEPDAWTISDASGGTHSLTTTNNEHGARALECVTTGGGGYVTALSDDYQLCEPGERIQLEFALEVSVATVRVRAQVLLYNSAKTLISTIDLYDLSAGNPTAYRKFGGPIRQKAVPSGAIRFFRVQLIAGESGGSVAATVRFDNVRSYIYHGSVPVERTLKATITTDTTTTIDISSNIGDDQNATFAQITLVPDFDVDPIYTIQGWVGGAWATVEYYNDSGVTRHTLTVPLNDANQFRVVTSNFSADTLEVYLAGKYVV